MSWIAKMSVAMALVSAGCSKAETSENETPSTEKAAVSEHEEKHAALDEAAAKDMFSSRCAACHGQQGLGDGPGAAALNPKPRNYHDKAWQAKVTDDDIKKTILYGGAAVGKSPMMPASPDLDSKPEVVDGLVHIVRTFGKS